MSSKNVLNKRVVNLLLSSNNANDSWLGASLLHLLPDCKRALTTRGLSTINFQPLQTGTATCDSDARKGYTTKACLQTHQQKLTAQAQTFKIPRRLSSSVSVGGHLGASASGITSAASKRGASTQAKQQVVEPEVINKYCDAFRCQDLEIIKCGPGELRQKPQSVDKLVFGHTFTDHMFRVDWDYENGWSTPLISKVHSLDIHPAAKALHYAIQAFEGVKAFRGHDNKIRFFRLDKNVKRLQLSAKRLALPDFDSDELIKCIHRLVHLDQDWIPRAQGRQLTSLYVRPTILGLEPSLGVAISKKAVLYVLLSPAGPYFKTGFKPVSLYADPNHVRAWPGGAGHTKLGSNYAPTIMVQRQAEKLGLQQVLWLFGDDCKLTEVGTMNVFVSIRNDETGKLHLVTPPLNDGLILPGITRASILELARGWNDVVVEERYITMGEIDGLIRENKLVEMFGAGTACIVCPISLIQMKDGTTFRIPYHDLTKTTGNDDHILTQRILKAITDIQYGQIPHPWAQELSY